MWNRASVGNLVLSLAALFVFMVALAAAIGFGVGVVELVVLFGLAVVGVTLIVRRFLAARGIARA